MPRAGVRVRAAGAVTAALAATAVIGITAVLIQALVATGHPDMRDAEPIRETAPRTTGPALAICGIATVEPGTLPETCDSNDRFWTNLRWSSWTPRSAFAVGEYWMRDMVGAKQFQAYPVRVELAHDKDAGPTAGYTTMTVTFATQSPGSALGHRSIYRITSSGPVLMKEDL